MRTVSIHVIRISIIVNKVMPASVDSIQILMIVVNTGVNDADFHACTFVSTVMDCTRTNSLHSPCVIKFYINCVHCSIQFNRSDMRTILESLNYRFGDTRGNCRNKRITMSHRPARTLYNGALGSARSFVKTNKNINAIAVILRRLNLRT